MKTTARILAVLIFLSVGLYSNAQEDMNRGNYLLKTYRAFERMNAGTYTLEPKDAEVPIDAGYFMGFVCATRWALELNKIINLREDVTNGQIWNIVGKYLKDHPADLHLHSYVLIGFALIQAVTLNKK
jgi:hypothetical protein